jgi:hypothetical protein
MRKIRFFTQIRSRLWLVALGVLLVPLAYAASPKAKPAGSKKVAQADALFASGEVLRIKIEIPEEGIGVLQKYQWQFGPQTNRETVRATVREGGRVYTNVALHLKGAAGSFRPVDQNPAMTLNFDKFVDAQQFHGLDKVSLNNSIQDPTFISEQFCREIFLKAGVPVPRATHAAVELNGRDLGLYVLTEGWDKGFLKRHFKNTKGNLYDGGFLKDITDELSANSGENSKDQSDRIALAEAAQEPNLTNRLARLNDVLDVDRFLTYVSLEVMLWDWDGYPLNRNNWRLYHDLDKKRMVFLPHGLDQMFWNPKGSILPRMRGLVARAALEIPELRQRYFQRIRELRATVFVVDAMTNRVRQIAAKVTPVLAEKDPESAKNHQEAVDGFCDSIVRRGRSLDQQLATPIEPLKFDDSGGTPLAGWEPKSDFGHPQIAKAPDERGKEALRIHTEQGSSIGSWRKSVWLEEGLYRIEGRIKTQGIVPDLGDPRGGAGFRLSTGRPEKYVIGDSDWAKIEREFTVSEPLVEKEILCEFRGADGEAWFDQESLKLQRVKPSPK